MEIRIIGIIGNDVSILNMFNYIFYKGVDNSNYTDYIIMNNDIPEHLKELVISIDKEKQLLFADTFGIKNYELKRKDWYDFKTHSFIKSENINIDHNRVYSADLFNITDISKRLGFPVDYPIVKIDELQKIYTETIDTLFGDIFLYRVYRKAYDIAFANERCFIYSINTIEEALTFKQTFFSTGEIIDITGESNIPYDYQLNKELLNQSEVIKFHHILNVTKFILL